MALNKSDKPEANPQQAMTQLASLGLTPEEWGGETAMLQVSALKGDGLEELLERVFLESEVLELKSHPEGPASGVVLEAEIQQGKGKVAHLLIQDGRLLKGRRHPRRAGLRQGPLDPRRPRQATQGSRSLLAGRGHGPQRAAVGRRLTSIVVDSLDRAQEVATERCPRRASDLADRANRSISKDNILEAVADQEKPTINLIVKADVQGSVEVLQATRSAR